MQTSYFRRSSSMDNPVSKDICGNIHSNSITSDKPDISVVSINDLKKWKKNNNSHCLPQRFDNSFFLNRATNSPYFEMPTTCLNENKRRHGFSCLLHFREAEIGGHDENDTLSICPACSCCFSYLLANVYPSSKDNNYLADLVDKDTLDGGERVDGNGIRSNKLPKESLLFSNISLLSRNGAVRGYSGEAECIGADGRSFSVPEGVMEKARWATGVKRIGSKQPHASCHHEKEEITIDKNRAVPVVSYSRNSNNDGKLLHQTFSPISSITIVKNVHGDPPPKTEAMLCNACLYSTPPSPKFTIPTYEDSPKLDILKKCFSKSIKRLENYTNTKDYSKENNLQKVGTSAAAYHINSEDTLNKNAYKPRLTPPLTLSPELLVQRATPKMHERNIFLEKATFLENHTHTVELSLPNTLVTEPRRVSLIVRHLASGSSFLSPSPPSPPRGKLATQRLSDASKSPFSSSARNYSSSQFSIPCGAATNGILNSQEPHPPPMLSKLRSKHSSPVIARQGKACLPSPFKKKKENVIHTVERVKYIVNKQGGDKIPKTLTTLTAVKGTCEETNPFFSTVIPSSDEEGSMKREFSVRTSQSSCGSSVFDNLESGNSSNYNINHTFDDLEFMEGARDFSFPMQALMTTAVTSDEFNDPQESYYACDHLDDIGRISFPSTSATSSSTGSVKGYYNTRNEGYSKAAGVTAEVNIKKETVVATVSSGLNEEKAGYNQNVFGDGDVSLCTVGTLPNEGVSRLPHAEHTKDSITPSHQCTLGTNQADKRKKQLVAIMRHDDPGGEGVDIDNDDNISTYFRNLALDQDVEVISRDRQRQSDSSPALFGSSFYRGRKRGGWRVGGTASSNLSCASVDRASYDRLPESGRGSRGGELEELFLRNPSRGIQRGHSTKCFPVKFSLEGQRLGVQRVSGYGSQGFFDRRDTTNSSTTHHSPRTVTDASFRDDNSVPSPRLCLCPLFLSFSSSRQHSSRCISCVGTCCSTPPKHDQCDMDAFESPLEHCRSFNGSGSSFIVAPYVVPQLLRSSTVTSRALSCGVSLRSSAARGFPRVPPLSKEDSGFYPYSDGSHIDSPSVFCREISPFDMQLNSNQQQFLSLNGTLEEEHRFVFTPANRENSTFLSRRSPVTEEDSFSNNRTRYGKIEEGHGGRMLSIAGTPSAQVHLTSSQSGERWSCPCRINSTVKESRYLEVNGGGAEESSSSKLSSLQQRHQQQEGWGPLYQISYLQQDGEEEVGENQSLRLLSIDSTTPLTKETDEKGDGRSASHNIGMIDSNSSPSFTRRLNNKECLGKQELKSRLKNICIPLSPRMVCKAEPRKHHSVSFHRKHKDTWISKSCCVVTLNHSTYKNNYVSKSCSHISSLCEFKKKPNLRTCKEMGAGSISRKLCINPTSFQKIQINAVNDDTRVSGSEILRTGNNLTSSSHRSFQGSQRCTAGAVFFATELPLFNLASVDNDARRSVTAPLIREISGTKNTNNCLVDSNSSDAIGGESSKIISVLNSLVECETSTFVWEASSLSARESSMDGGKPIQYLESVTTTSSFVPSLLNLSCTVHPVGGGGEIGGEWVGQNGASSSEINGNEAEMTRRGEVAMVDDIIFPLHMNNNSKIECVNLQQEKYHDDSNNYINRDADGEKRDVFFLNCSYPPLAKPFFQIDMMPIDSHGNNGDGALLADEGNYQHYDRKQALPISLFSSANSLNLSCTRENRGKVEEEVESAIEIQSSSNCNEVKLFFEEGAKFTKGVVLEDVVVRVDTDEKSMMHSHTGGGGGLFHPQSGTTSGVLPLLEATESTRANINTLESAVLAENISVVVSEREEVGAERISHHQREANDEFVKDTLKKVFGGIENEDINNSNDNFDNKENDDDGDCFSQSASYDEEDAFDFHEKKMPETELQSTLEGIMIPCEHQKQGCKNNAPSSPPGCSTGEPSFLLGVKDSGNGQVEKRNAYEEEEETDEEEDEEEDSREREYPYYYYNDDDPLIAYTCKMPFPQLESSGDRMEDIMTLDDVMLLHVPEPHLAGRQLLVLDLDETLIHACDEEEEEMFEERDNEEQQQHEGGSEENSFGEETTSAGGADEGDEENDNDCTNSNEDAASSTIATFSTGAGASQTFQQKSKQSQQGGRTRPPFRTDLGDFKIIVDFDEYAKQEMKEKAWRQHQRQLLRQQQHVYHQFRKNRKRRRCLGGDDVKHRRTDDEDMGNNINNNNTQQEPQGIGHHQDTLTSSNVSLPYYPKSSCASEEVASEYVGRPVYNCIQPLRGQENNNNTSFLLSSAPLSMPYYAGFQYVSRREPIPRSPSQSSISKCTCGDPLCTCVLEQQPISISNNTSSSSYDQENSNFLSMDGSNKDKQQIKDSKEGNTKRGSSFRNFGKRIVYVHARPHLKEFLEEVSKLFEVVVFTAGIEPYAREVVNALDPDAVLIHHLLHRKHCTKVLNSVVVTNSGSIATNVNLTMDYNTTAVTVAQNDEEANGETKCDETSQIQAALPMARRQSFKSESQGEGKGGIVYAASEYGKDDRDDYDNSDINKEDAAYAYLINTLHGSGERKNIPEASSTFATTKPSTAYRRRVTVNDLISHNRKMETAFPHQYQYVKDLSLLNRRLDRIVIMDNSPTSYLFQPRNAISCGSWFGHNRDDEELLAFLPMLKHMSSEPHVYDMLDQFHEVMAQILAQQRLLHEQQLQQQIQPFPIEAQVQQGDGNDGENDDCLNLSSPSLSIDGIQSSYIKDDF